jgi:hypothetical protein
LDTTGLRLADTLTLSSSALKRPGLPGAADTVAEFP